MEHETRTAAQASPVRYEWASARPSFRSTVLQSRYYLSAYLRFVLSLVVLAGVYTLLAGKITSILVAAELQRVREAHHWSLHNAWEPHISQLLSRRFPTGTLEAGVLEGYVHVGSWLVGQTVVPAVLLVGGVTALVLQRTAGS